MDPYKDMICLHLFGDFTFDLCWPGYDFLGATEIKKIATLRKITTIFNHHYYFLSQMSSFKN